MGVWLFGYGGFGLGMRVLVWVWGFWEFLEIRVWVYGGPPLVVWACGGRDSVDLSAYSCYLNKCKQSLTAAYLASQQQRGGDQFLKCFYRFVQQQALKMTR